VIDYQARGAHPSFNAAGLYVTIYKHAYLISG